MYLKRNICFGLIFVLCIIFSFPHTSIPFELQDSIIEYTLENGMRFLILPRHFSPTVSLYIRFKVGGVDEGTGKTGATHMLEHMLFKGTKKIGTKNFQEEAKILDKIFETGEMLDNERLKGEYADNTKITTLKDRLKALQEAHSTWIIRSEMDTIYTENGGIGFNASTGKDLTTYMISLPSDKLPLWATIESDRMQNLVFREYYLERDVVREERRRKDSDPFGQLYEQFISLAYSAHPYGVPTIGWESDIRVLKKSSVEEFYKRYYGPNNAVVAIVGDVDPHEVKKLMGTYFSTIPSKPLPLPLPTVEPPQRGERRVAVKISASSQIMIGFHKPSLPHHDDYVFDIIDSVLSSGRTSRLYTRLVEDKKIATDVWTANGIPGSRYPNLFVLSATPNSPHTTLEIESEIYDMLEDLKTNNVSKEELDKTKNRFRAEFVRNLRTNSGIARAISYYEVLAGDWSYMVKHMDIIERITPDDIKRVARTYFIKENRTVAYIE